MEILVIILSIFLALFLIVGIVLALLLIKVTLQIRKVTRKAEWAANSFESVTRTMSSATLGAAFGRVILKGAKSLYKKSKGGKR